MRDCQTPEELAVGVSDRDRHRLLAHDRPARIRGGNGQIIEEASFNGEHHAGPLAMISLPDATTGLGPLCSNPETSTTPARCNP